MTDNKPSVVVYPRKSNLPPLIEQDGKTQRRNRRKQELRKRKGRGKRSLTTSPSSEGEGK